MTVELLKQLDGAVRRFLLVLAGLIVASGIPAALWGLADPHHMYKLVFLVLITFATIFGLPVYLVRRANGEANLQSAIVTGMVIGMTPPIIGAILSLIGGASVFFVMLFFAALYGAVGATSGAIFWLIVVYPVPGASSGVPSIGLTLMACLTATAIVAAGLLTI